jgi:hypothetical protein
MADDGVSAWARRRASNLEWVVVGGSSGGVALSL